MTKFQKLREVCGKERKFGSEKFRRPSLAASYVSAIEEGEHVAVASHSSFYPEVVVGVYHSKRK